MTKRQTSIVLIFLVIVSVFSLGSAEQPAITNALAAAEPYATPMDGQLRVWLQSLGVREALGLTLAGVYSVDGDRGFQFEPGTELKLGLDGGRITLQAGGAAIDMGGGFTLVRHLDDQDNAGGAYIHESEKDTLYCGDLSFGILSGGGLRVIVTIDIEDYLYGVLPYEMSDTFPLEALKAQAVAARSYAMQRKTRNANETYDVVDTANDQVYKGFDARYTRPIQAVDETRGIVGMTNGSYAELFYSASNGGQTALASDVWGKGDNSYLAINDDPYDLENPESVVRTATVSKDGSKMKESLASLLIERIERKLKASGEMAEGDTAGIASVVNVEAVDPIYGGGSRQYRTIRFTVTPTVRRAQGGTGQTGQAASPVEDVVIDLSFYDHVRSALNISINGSAYDLLEVTETDTGFTLTTRRYGHGVGLSQRGAQQMAGQYGKTYLEILSYYYPGLDLVQMTWIEKPIVKAAALPESLGYAAARPTPAPTPAPLPPLSPGEHYAVVSVEGVDQTVNVRETPSAEGAILGRLRSGTRLIVIEALEDGWTKMKTAELEGFIMTRFVKPEGASDGQTDAAAPTTTAAPDTGTAPMPEQTEPEENTETFVF